MGVGAVDICGDRSIGERKDAGKVKGVMRVLPIADCVAPEARGVVRVQLEASRKRKRSRLSPTNGAGTLQIRRGFPRALPRKSSLSCSQNTHVRSVGQTHNEPAKRTGTESRRVPRAWKCIAGLERMDGPHPAHQ